MKKLLALMMAAVMLFALAACGGEAQPSASPDASPSAEASANPSTDPSAAPSDNGDADADADDDADADADADTDGPKVEMVGDNVVFTATTTGVTQVQTFVYNGDELQSASLEATLDAGVDVDAFVAGLEATDMYVNVVANGSTVTADYADTFVSTFAMMTKDQLVQSLELGGDMIS